jgi:hypothetical protein
MQRARSVLVYFVAIYKAFPTSGLYFTSQNFKGGRFAGAIQAQKPLVFFLFKYKLTSFTF